MDDLNKEEREGVKDLLTRMEIENKILSEMVDRSYEQNRRLMREVRHLQETIDEMRKKDGQGS